MHRRKYILPILFFFLLAAGFASCEKVINVSIDEVNKKYVIEGQITDNTNSARVNLSQTIDITDSNKFNGVEDAKITLSENGRTPVVLTHSGGGIYRANMTGRPGASYKLVVSVHGQTYTAVSTMPRKVAFDTLYVTERTFLGRMRKIATAEFYDPPGVGDAYRFVQYIDGRKENSVFAFDDNLIDGRKIIYELLIFGDPEYTLKKDDQLRVEMRCIGAQAYQFWYSLTQGALGQNQSASPANPVSNIQGGAIGYFSAQTFEVRNIAVK